jgi:hypothetical protein
VAARCSHRVRLRQSNPTGLLSTVRSCRELGHTPFCRRSVKYFVKVRFLVSHARPSLGAVRIATTFGRACRQRANPNSGD